MRSTMMVCWFLRLNLRIYCEVTPGDVREEEDGEVVVWAGETPDCSKESSYEE